MVSITRPIDKLLKAPTQSPYDVGDVGRSYQMVELTEQSTALTNSIAGKLIYLWTRSVLVGDYLTVTLPDATTLTAGLNVFGFSNYTRKIVLFRDSTGTLLLILKPNSNHEYLSQGTTILWQSAMVDRLGWVRFHLQDNTTVAGTWDCQAQGSMWFPLLISEVPDYPTNVAGGAPVDFDMSSWKLTYLETAGTVMRFALIFVNTDGYLSGRILKWDSATQVISYSETISQLSNTIGLPAAVGAFNSTTLSIVYINGTTDYRTYTVVINTLNDSFSLIGGGPYISGGLNVNSGSLAYYAKSPNPNVLYIWFGDAVNGVRALAQYRNTQLNGDNSQTMGGLPEAFTVDLVNSIYDASGNFTQNFSNNAAGGPAIFEFVHQEFNTHLVIGSASSVTGFGAHTWLANVSGENGQNPMTCLVELPKATSDCRNFTRLKYNDFPSLLPSPFSFSTGWTLTNTTLGTTENLVINGDFVDAMGIGWTTQPETGSGWSIITANGLAAKTAGTGYLVQDVSLNLVSGKIYAIRHDRVQWGGQIVTPGNIDVQINEKRLYVNRRNQGLVEAAYRVRLPEDIVDGKVLLRLGGTTADLGSNVVVIDDVSMREANPMGRQMEVLYESDDTGIHSIEKDITANINGDGDYGAGIYVCPKGRTKGALRLIIGTQEVVGKIDLTDSDNPAITVSEMNGVENLVSKIMYYDTGFYYVHVGGTFSAGEDVTATWHFRLDTDVSDGEEYQGDSTKGMGIWHGHIKNGRQPCTYKDNTFYTPQIVYYNVGYTEYVHMRVNMGSQNPIEGTYNSGSLMDVEWMGAIGVQSYVGTNSGPVPVDREDGGIIGLGAPGNIGIAFGQRWTGDQGNAPATPSFQITPNGCRNHYTYNSFSNTLWHYQVGPNLTLMNYSMYYDATWTDIGRLNVSKVTFGVFETPLLG